MCGIAGKLHLDGRPVDVSLIAAMTDLVSHRGPDDHGVWTDGNIALGHRRLSIRDLSRSGHQPLSDPTGRIWITYNGEIYNDQALRRELERDFGCVFRTTCDAEVIPAGYLAWGVGLFKRLEGMFAIGLWDRQKKQLVLARDGVGIKPLYYSKQNDVIRFGSELKVLLADEAMNVTISQTALRSFLAQGYVSPSGSLLDDVGQIPPGTVRIIDRDGVVDRQFWQPSRRSEILNENDALEVFEPLWAEVLNDMRVSDVPIGILQSGGIDSSLVTTVMGRDGDIPAFTAQFAEESHDETALAQRVTDQVGAEHHLIPVQSAEDGAAVFSKLVEHFDGQVADSSAYAFYQLCGAVRKKVTVAVSGDGADEFFGGYPTYRASRVAHMIQPLVPSALAKGAGDFFMKHVGGKESRLPLIEVLSRFSYGLSAPRGASHAHWRNLMPLALLDEVSPPGGKALAENPLLGYTDAAHSAEGDRVDKCLLADQRFYLPSDMLMKVDAMSMAHGLEVRVPFLDRRIMDFAGRLDHRLLTPFFGKDKKILRAALARAGAHGCVTSAPKKGFNVPVASILRSSLAGLGERLLNKQIDRLAPYLQPEVVRRMWKEHKDYQANHGYGLWAILTFAVWKETLQD